MPNGRENSRGTNRMKNPFHIAVILCVGKLPVLQLGYIQAQLRCITCRFFFKVLQILSFVKFFKYITLTLSCFDLGSNMNR